MLVGFCFDRSDEPETQLLLAELEELVDTLGIKVVGMELVRVRDPHRGFICGTGKADELVQLLRAVRLRSEGGPRSRRGSGWQSRRGPLSALSMFSLPLPFSLCSALSLCSHSLLSLSALSLSLSSLSLSLHIKSRPVSAGAAPGPAAAAAERAGSASSAPPAAPPASSGSPRTPPPPGPRAPRSH